MVSLQLQPGHLIWSAGEDGAFWQIRKHFEQNSAMITMQRLGMSLCLATV